MVIFSFPRASFAALVLSCVAISPVAAQHAPTSEAKPAAAGTASKAWPSPAISVMARAMNDPAAIAGTGWQEQAHALVKEQLKKNPELKTLRKRSHTALQSLLSKAAKTYGLPEAFNDTVKQSSAKPMLRYRLYMSQSLGKTALKASLAYGAAHRDMVIIYSGVLKGQTVVELGHKVGAGFGHVPKRGEPIPNVAINSVPFSDHHVLKVPRIEVLDSEGKPIAWAYGVMDPAWIEAKVEGGARGDLGQFGNTGPIAEVNLAEIMREKMRSVDIRGMKQKAVGRFWTKLKMAYIPPATEARVYKLDPTFVVTRDIKLPDGRYIAHKGDKVNLLKTVGFHQKLLIFDVTDPKQVAYAKGFLAQNRGKKVTLLTTRSYRENGWSGWRNAENALGHVFYLYNASFQRTWPVKAVPSIVEAKGDVFVITEVPLSPQKHQAAHKES